MVRGVAALSEVRPCHVTRLGWPFQTPNFQYIFCFSLGEARNGSVVKVRGREENLTSLVLLLVQHATGIHDTTGITSSTT